MAVANEHDPREASLRPGARRARSQVAHAACVAVIVCPSLAASQKIGRVARKIEKSSAFCARQGRSGVRNKQRRKQVRVAKQINKRQIICFRILLKRRWFSSPIPPSFPSLNFTLAVCTLRSSFPPSLPPTLPQAAPHHPRPPVSPPRRKEGRKEAQNERSLRPSPSFPPFPGRALARLPFPCSSVTADAAAPAAAFAVLGGQWKMRASLARSLARSHAQSVSETENLAEDRSDSAARTGKEGRTGRGGPPSLPLGLSLRAIFTQPGVGSGESPSDGRTEGRGRAIPISASPDGRTDGRTARDSSLPPFHSALLHNSNVEGKNGRERT